MALSLSGAPSELHNILQCSFQHFLNFMQDRRKRKTAFHSRLRLSGERLERRLMLCSNVSGTYNTDQVWADTSQPYCLVGDVVIGAGASLSIGPGVEVRNVNSNNEMYVRGRVTARDVDFTGTETELIVEATGTLDLSSGSTLAGHRVLYQPNSRGSIIDSIFSSARLEVFTAGLADISGNTFEGPIPVYANPSVVPKLYGTNRYTSQATIQLAGTMFANADFAMHPNLSRYQLLDDVIVPAAYQLNIQPGLTLHNDNQHAELFVHGRLHAADVDFTGTESELIVEATGTLDLSSGSTVAGQRVLYQPNSLGSIKDSTFSSARLEVFTAGVSEISGNTFQAVAPVYANPAVVPKLYGTNRYTNQATIQLAGTMFASADLSIHPNLSRYQLLDDVIVPATYQLNIQPGLTLHNDNQHAELFVHGQLHAADVGFTGPQTELIVASGGELWVDSAAVLAGNRISYAANSRGRITCSEISLQVDIDSGADLDLIGNEIAIGSVRASGNGAIVIDFTNQYWGTPAPNEIEGRVFHKNDDARLPLVNFTPFLTTPPATCSAPPVLPPIADQSVSELQAVEFQIRVIDSDTPPELLEFNLDRGPITARIDPVTGKFSWLPSESQGPGLYNFEARVRDKVYPNLEDTVTFSIAVADVNVAPNLQRIGDQIVNETEAIEFVVLAEDSDIPQNKLTYSMGSNGPAGATFNPETGEFSWTPTEDQGPGQYAVSFQVTDDGVPRLSSSESITITVGELNQAPKMNALQSQSVDELTLLSLFVHATDQDRPAQALTYSFEAPAPAGARLDASTGEFSWMPSESQGPGEYVLKIRATDDGVPARSVERQLTISVKEVNSPPELPPLQDRLANELEAIEFLATASDSDIPLNRLTYQFASTAPAGATIDASSGSFSWTPSESQGPGTYPISIQVFEVANPSSTAIKTFEVQVNEVNSAPTIAPIPDQSLSPGQALSHLVIVEDNDLPSNASNLVLLQGPEGAVLNPQTFEISWVPTSSQLGTHQFVLEATDDGQPSLTSQASFVVVVSENRPPEFERIPNQRVDEQTELQLAIRATDPEHTNVVYRLDANRPSGASINASSGVFTWIPDESHGPGSYTLTVYALDEGVPPVESSSTFTIEVGEVNLPPELKHVPELRVSEGKLLTALMKATDADVPINSLSFGFVGEVPDGMSIDSLSGEIRWTPSEAQGPDQMPFQVAVYDESGASSVLVVIVHVDEVNSPPTMSAVQPPSIAEGFQMALEVEARDVDIPVQPLRFSLSTNAPSGMEIDANAGIVRWTPGEFHGPGVFQVSVTISDGVDSINQMFIVEVTDNAPYQYFVNNFDVNVDGLVTPIDVLLVINHLNSYSGDLGDGLPKLGDPLVDVNGNGFVSPIDALLVINWLNQRDALRSGEPDDQLVPVDLFANWKKRQGKKVSGTNGAVANILARRLA